jgi:hypothetical protein
MMEEQAVLQHPELSARYAREQYLDNCRNAARRRLVARAEGRKPSLARRAARPLGQALLRLGAGLLRYGQAEQPATANRYRRSAGPIELN